jgi:hypothetical protein
VLSTTIKNGNAVSGNVSVSSIYEPGATYYVRVKANADTAAGLYGNSKYSDAVRITSIVAGTLSSPANVSATINGKVIAVAWEKVDNAVAYVIQVSTDPKFKDDVLTTTIKNGNAVSGNISVSSIHQPGATYYVRVKANADTAAGLYTNSKYSDAIRITYAVDTPKLTSVTANSNASIAVAWEKVNHAVAYVIQVSTDPNFKDNVLSTTIKNANAVSGNISVTSIHQPGATYYVRVKANADVADELYGNSKYSDAFKITYTLDTPVLTSVMANGNARIDVTWEKVKNAVAYVIQVSTDPNFKTNVLSSTIKDGNAVSGYIGGLTTGATYFVRVKANADTAGLYGNSKYSDSWPYTFKPLALTAPLSSFDYALSLYLDEF